MCVCVLIIINFCGEESKPVIINKVTCSPVNCHLHTVLQSYNKKGS